MTARTPAPLITRPRLRSEPAPVGRIIRGIRTEFAGVWFRSRLEACFACFFTGLGIGWDYEPTDLAGYIPDFDLLFKRAPLLVEVKPLQDSIAEAKSKIECSGWTGDAAIVISGEYKIIGEIFEADIGWDRAVLTFCTACKKPTIVAEGGRWSCRNCREGNGRTLWWPYSAREHWSQAKNETQWRPE